VNLLYSAQYQLELSRACSSNLSL